MKILDSQSDSQWIKNIKEDDYTSYNQLFMYYYPKLCVFVNSIINDRYDTEDIVQDLFVKLWTNRKEIDLQTNISAYLFRTAKNKAINFIRDEANRKILLEKIGTEDESYLDGNFPDEDEYDEALLDCIRQLPPRCKEILLMHRVDGYKQKEIAEKLNISLQTIKNQTGAALRRLKNCLELKKQ
ncbi:MAG: RNA polymerase sigma-70 factor [Dysgonamonadaceae bacterium]|jgi:RNA polymerase sigma-70 factor (ECF subfamily)|nr:RNA polymerase sigma-70 factor [Dysgonamonadaceae bacterium]